MSPVRRKILRSLPAFVWMGMIFNFSHQPGGGSGALSRLVMGYLARLGIDFAAWFGGEKEGVWMLRKLAHFTEYMLLFGLLSLAITTWLPWQRARWWALLGTFLYACSDELHQLFIPHRVGDLVDVGIDTAGGATGLVLCSLVMALRARRARNASPTPLSRP